MSKKRRGKHPGSDASPAAPGGSSADQPTSHSGESAPAPEHSGTAPAHTHRHFGGHLLVDFLLGVLFTVVMWTVCTFVEERHYYVGTLAKEMVYGVLQHRLSVSDTQTDVYVVDISGMPMVCTTANPNSTGANSNSATTFNGNTYIRGAYDFTSRDDLQKVVDAVASESPKSIGIDIDFTPTQQQYIQDDAFLDHCLAKARQAPPVPIFVALFTSLLRGPDRCLEEPKFHDLAAFGAAPNPEKFESPHMMVGTLHVTTGIPGEAPWAVRSLAAAVANQVVAPVPWAKAWAVQNTVSVAGDQFQADEFYVDFGALDTLESDAHTIPYTQLAQPRYAGILKDKYVLIGRGTGTTDMDQHIVPGRYDRTHSGVYLHACAVNTLLDLKKKGRTLVMLRSPGRLAVDLLLFSLIFILVETVKWAGVRLIGAEARVGIAHMIVTFIVVVGATIAGIYLVSYWGVLWNDSPFVAAGLFLHAIVDHAATGV